MDINISSFPLFNTLYNECIEMKEPIDYESQMEICRKIKLLDDEGHEILIVLIAYFHLNVEKGYGLNPFPHQPRMIKQGLKFDMTNFPMLLIKMIYRFLQLHEKKIQDEQFRINNI